jgi:mono/diheme cytochrome c family protein
MGAPDLTPSAAANPVGDPGNDVISTKDFTLYKANTTASQANTPIVSEQSLGVQFDEATQTFKTSTGGVAQTSIYRAFPGSQSDTVDVDDEVVVLNNNVGKLFPGNDVRQNYRLAGAVWLQKPDAFKLDVRFEDAALQGENRLSGMAMESFTQDQNCFACHHTKVVKNDTTAKPIISAKLLNVSHVISKFLAGQTPTFDDVKRILDHAMGAWTQQNGPADLTGHGATFKWDTKANLLAAVGHGKRLIQREVIGNGRGKEANLVIDLRTGLPQRMPKGGPFLDEAAIQRIEDWINAGCPD